MSGGLTWPASVKVHAPVIPTVTVPALIHGPLKLVALSTP
jgi:hypothetical protein